MINLDKLIILPHPNDLDIKDIDRILDADWYEVDGVLMADCEAINFLSEAGPEDAGIDICFRGESVVKIDDCLKRYNEIDGFYHA